MHFILSAFARFAIVLAVSLFGAIFCSSSSQSIAKTVEAENVNVYSSNDGCNISSIVKKYYGGWVYAFKRPVFAGFIIINGFKKAEKIFSRHNFQLLTKIVHDKEFHLGLSQITTINIF